MECEVGEGPGTRVKSHLISLFLKQLKFLIPITECV